MVNFLVPALGFAALLPFSLAIPATPEAAIELALRDESFSFLQWVEDKIADPEGNHLSIEEALEAGTPVDVEERSANVDIAKRAPTCNNAAGGGRVASAPDAVWCIDYLASLGSTPCRANYPEPNWFCSHGTASIVGVTNQPGGTQSACNDVARALGGIMDHCWRADNTVQGTDFAYGNGYLAVHIVGN